MILLSELAAIALFLVFYGLLNFPALLNISTTYLCGTRGDPGIYLWLTKYNIANVLTYPSQGFNAPFFYPYGKSLAYTDNYLLPSAYTKLLMYFGADLILSYNLTLLTAFALNGYLTYRLARFLGVSKISSFLSGFAFMCSPKLFWHLGHPQLQFAFFIPGTLLASLSFAQKRSWFSATCIGLCVYGAFLCAVYYAMFCYLLAMITLLGCGAILWRKIATLDLVRLFAVNLPWGILTFFTIQPYLAVRNAFGTTITDVLRKQSATLFSYISAPSHNLVWGPLTAAVARLEAYLFSGVTTLILAGLSIHLLFARMIHSEGVEWVRFRRGYLLLISLFLTALVTSYISIRFDLNGSTKDYLISVPMWTLLATTFYLLIQRGRESPGISTLSRDDLQFVLLFILSFFVFASLGIIGKIVPHTHKISLYAFIFRFLPGYTAIRGVSRIGIVAILVISIFAGIGLDRVCARFKTDSSRFLISFGLIALLGLELKCVKYPTAHDEPQPTVFSYLNTIPGDEAVIALPSTSMTKEMISFIRTQSDYVQWLLPTNRKMVNGYSGKIPPWHQNRFEDLIKFPSKKSLQILGRIASLRYVVYYPKHAPKFRKRIFEKKLIALSDQVELLHKDTTGYVLKINPVIDIFNFDGPTIQFPPDVENERTLSFEIQSKRTEKDSNCSIPPIFVHLGEISKKDDKEKIEPITISTPNTWQRVKLTLPKSIRSVIPHVVKFETKDPSNNCETLVREIRVE